MRLSLRLIAGAAVLLAAPMANAQTAAPADYAVVAMKPDVAFLTAEEKQVVNLLIQAADVMTTIFDKQKVGRPRRPRPRLLSGRHDQGRVRGLCRRPSREKAA
jgi:hypothetical protein